MQDIQKVITTTKILNLLIKRGRLRWQELKKSTNVSSRTLSDRLQDLIDNGIVKRKVDPETHPPSTYYEINPNIEISNFPQGHVYSTFQKFLDTKNQSASLLRLIEKRTPKETLENTFNAFKHDLLFTLDYCAENPDYSEYLALLYLDQYQTQIENLILSIKNNDKYGESIKSIFEDFIRDQKKNVEKEIIKALTNFEDKELARAVLVLYFGSAFTYNMELYIFLVQMAQSEELKVKLEKEFGAPVEEERLNKLISESAWKDIESFSTTHRQITNHQKDT